MSPALSVKQRRLAGMALAAREGRGPAPGGMMDMSLEDLKHYAGTSEKGLPKRKGEEGEEVIDSPMTPAQRNFTEKALAYAEFIRNNRLYAFREATADERLVEAAVGEQLFFPPNPKQALILEAWNNPIYKTFTLTGANQIGKTTIEAVIGWSFLFGKWLWNDVRIPIDHHSHRKVRLVGEAWESHVKTVLIPKLREWWPKNRPLDTKKNNQGVEAVWKDLATGGTLEVMSSTQDVRVFAGWEGDLVIFDEPPPREVWIECARGLIKRNGRSLIGATLLNEAWVHREVIKARLENGQPDPSVFNVNAVIEDNLGYGLTQEGIDTFARKLKPHEKEARLKGKPSYLGTLVFPDYNQDLHVKEPFKIPLDWIVDISIDFHPSKPWAVVFMATARNNFKYVCKEIHDKGNPKYIAEEIIRAVREGQWRVGRCVIDPLAKGDSNNDNTVYEIMGNVLGAHNISLDTASKDKDNGIALVNNLLMTENQIPGLFFFKDCPKTYTQVADLMYDKDSLKPTAVKVDDDFTECVYRLALLDTQWFAPIIFDMKNQRNVIL